MSKKNNISLSFSNTSEHHRENVLKSIANRKTEYLIAYLLLFAACLLTVAHILDFRIPLLLVVLYVIIRNHTLLGKSITLFWQPLLHYLFLLETLDVFLSSAISSAVL